MIKVAQNTILQAYRSAPWRNQYQLMGVYALIVVGVAVIAGIYLNVTARAATMGREVQSLQEVILDTRQRNSDLEIQYAQLTSYAVMSDRARELGFKPTGPEQIVYVGVPGYQPGTAVEFAPPPALEISNEPVLPPGFNETLFEWLARWVAEPSQIITQIQPAMPAQEGQR